MKEIQDIQKISDIKNPVLRLQARLSIVLTFIWVIPLFAYLLQLSNIFLAENLLNIGVFDFGIHLIISLLLWAFIGFSLLDSIYNWNIVDPSLMVFSGVLLIVFLIAYLLSFLFLYLILFPLHALYWLVYLMGKAFKEGSST